MSYRHIKPIAKAGLEAANLKGAVSPQFLWVDPAMLMVNEAYQRNLSEKSITLIRKIVAGWDWSKFKPPIVVKSDDGYMVIDGQHTAIAAATHGGLRTIPVMMVHAPELVDQAAAFLGQNRDRVAMTSMQMHHAAVVAGDADAIAVQRVADACGVRILRGPPGNGQYKAKDTVSIEAIRSTIRRRGEAGAIAVLQCVADANPAPIGQAHIRAADALMFDPDFGLVKPAAITSALISMGFLLDREAKLFAATHNIKTHWKAVAAVLLKRINNGRRRAA